ncbi:unnamed protein product [Closterium sp. NIES-53]
MRGGTATSTTSSATSSTAAAASTTASTAATDAPTPGTTPTTTSTSSTASSTAPSTTLASLALASAASPTRGGRSADLLSANEVDSSSRGSRGEKGGQGNTPQRRGSSCEAEIYARAMAAQELRWLTYLLTDLGEAPHSPPVLYQCGQLRLAYVASQATTVDVFTKALQPCDHQRFCTVLGLVPTFPHLLTS